MEKEFNLSEKRLCVNGRTKNFYYKEPDIKEFIKRVEKARKKHMFCDEKGWQINIKGFDDELKELAGDDLI